MLSQIPVIGPAVSLAYNAKSIWDFGQRTLAVADTAGKMASGAASVVDGGGAAVMVAATTFVSYYGMEAYRSMYSTIFDGLNHHAKRGAIGALLNRSDEIHTQNTPRARVFIAGIVSIIFQWIQHQGALAMRDRTMRENVRQKFASASMTEIDKQRIENYRDGGIDDGAMMLYGTYNKHPYYRGEKSYTDLRHILVDLDASSIILRPILNVLVGISVQVENIFFQTGNFDHVHFLSNLFQSIGLYEIIVHVTRQHEWSLIQTALMTFLKKPKQINARRRR
jgi:hypothetical protein